MFRILPLVLVVGCADVHHAVHVGKDGRISWQLRVAPTADSDWPSPPDVIAHVVAPVGQNAVRAWSETDDSRRTWLVIHAAAANASAWNELRAALIARTPGGTPGWLHPPHIEGDPPTLDMTVIPDSATPRSEGRWTLSLHGFSAPDADVRALGAGARWSRTLAEVSHQGLSIHATSSQVRPTLPGGAPLAALGAGTAGLWLIGRLVRRQVQSSPRAFRLRRRT